MTNEDIIQRALERLTVSQDCSNAETLTAEELLYDFSDKEKPYDRHVTTIRQCLTQAIELQAVAEEMADALEINRSAINKDACRVSGMLNCNRKQATAGIVALEQALSKYRELKGE